MASISNLIPFPSKSDRSAEPLRNCILSTKATSREEFVAQFVPFLEPHTLFIPAVLKIEPGQSVKFAFSIKGGHTLLSGRGDAIDIVPVGQGPRKKAGVRISLLEIDVAARGVYEAILRKKGVAIPTSGPAVPKRNVSELPTRVVPNPLEAGRRAAAAAAAAAAASDHKTLSPGPVSAAPGQRTPGSPLTLPANPFSNIDTAALSFFVECTLTEDNDGTFSWDDGAEPMPPESLLEDDEPEIVAVVPPAPPPALPLPLPPPMPALSKSRANMPALPSMVVSAALAATDRDLSAVPVKEPVAVAEPSLVEEAAYEPTPAFAMVAPEAVGPMVALRTRFARLPAWARIAAPAAAATLLVLALIGALSGRTSPAKRLPVAAAPKASVAPAITPITVPAAAEPAVAPSAPNAAADKAAARPAGKGVCSASLTSQPSGALAVVGRRKLGRTPLSNARVPCGEAEVVFRHVRYSSAALQLTSTPDAPGSLSARLVRPRAQLALSSTPDGAVFKVNRVPAGRGPRKLEVSRFESLRVEAVLPGYAPWKKTVYMRGATLKLNATLARAR